MDGAKLVRRKDDTKEVILTRLKAYKESTDPMLSYYSRRGLHRIDGAKTPIEIHRDIEKVLEQALAQRVADESG